MGSRLPELHFLTHDPDATDYRPAIDGRGTTVVFERTPKGGGPTVLYSITDLSSPNPEPFLSGSSLPTSQTRPDWCWATGRVAFDGANGGLNSVYVVGSDGSDPTEVPGTEGYAYPRWSHDGSSMVSENQSAGEPHPRNTVFDATTGAVIEEDVDGVDHGGHRVFGGMPAVGPADLPQIAFAGQPMLVGWAGSTTTRPQYNEDFNYVFLNGTNEGRFFSAPMERHASIRTFDAAYQGRAPSWSPDGSLIAFESNRSGKGYAIYLFHVKHRSVTQVTHPILQAQHAKFFPGGTKLVLTVFHPHRDPPTRGIAWVDVSGLLEG